MEWLAVYEGGFVDHPDDPGGATNRGVTQAVYDAFRRRQDQTPRSVRWITDEEHDAIYVAQYWRPIRGDDLPSGLDATVFDFGVNSGTGRAAKTLQRALVAMGYRIAVDGQIGEMTLDAVRTVASVGGLPDLIIDVNERRFRFVKGLKTFRTFGRGWTRRIMGDRLGVQDGDVGVIDRSIMLARGDRPETIRQPNQPAPGRARDRDLGWLAVLIEAVVAFVDALFRNRKGAA